MNVHVRLFAEAREAAGTSTIEVIGLSAHADVKELVDRLGSQCGERLQDAIRAPGVRAAVNQEIVDCGHRLADGDEVAFLPRVTGG